MTAAETTAENLAAAESGAKAQCVLQGAPGMEGAVALRSLTLQNVLSFGAEAKVELAPLNVLIGPNGCGKSNLMDVIALLKAAARTDLSDEFRGGGADWPWKGGTEKLPDMRVWSSWGKSWYCFHGMTIRVSETGNYLVVDESVEIDHGDFREVTVWRREDADGRASLLRVGTPMTAKTGDSPVDTGVAEQVRGVLSEMAGGVCVYRGRFVGRTGRGQNPLRVAGRADESKDRVSESLGNFPNVLNRVYAVPECREAINEKMRELNEDARGIYFNVAHGAVEVALQEEGGRAIPASRMSDGMLNWLFLLTVLLDPKPPALVCIDEPETGLHMDSFPALAELLREASARTQIVITTHSDMLVDHFTHDPEAVVVCDKVDGVTRMKRLCAADFQEWKEEGLGMAWVSGAVGGKRW